MNSLKVVFACLFWIISLKVYSQSNAIDTSLELLVEIEKFELKVPDPVLLDPLNINAKAVWSENKDQFAIVMKAELFSGWQIYASVPENSPYKSTKIKLILPEIIEPISEWEMPVSRYYTKEIEVYMGELHFIRYFKVSDSAKLGSANIECGLYYQACDANKCYRPKTKMIELNLTNK